MAFDGRAVSLTQSYTLGFGHFAEDRATFLNSAVVDWHRLEKTEFGDS
jgi:hypothetical protein